MKINEIVNPHTPGDKTFDAVAGVNADEIESLYNSIVYASDSFRINKEDAAPPEIIQEFEDMLIIVSEAVIRGSTSYKMLVEIQQWLSE